MDRRLIWLALGAFSTSTVAFAFAGLLPLIAASTGVSVSGAGYLMTAFSLAYAIGTPILSTLLGGADRRRVIALALGAFCVGNFLAAIGNSYGSLLAAQMVMGASAGTFAATAQATAIALAGPEHRARAVSAVLGGTTMAVAFGAPLGALIGNLAGWRMTFLFVSALALFCLTVLWFRLPRDLAGTKLGLGERFMVIGRRGVRSSLAITFFYLTGAFTVICYLAPLATEGAGLPASAVSLMLLVFGVGAVAGNMASGWLTDLIGPTRVVFISLVSSAVLCGVMSLVVTALPPGVAGPVLIGLMLPWGIIGWTFPPAQASRLVGYAPELAGLTMPLNVSAMYFGIASGSFIGGQVLAIGGAGELGIVGAIFPLVGLTILAATQRRLQPAGSMIG